jgi:hypothetical protein
VTLRCSEHEPMTFRGASPIRLQDYEVVRVNTTCLGSSCPDVARTDFVVLSRGGARLQESVPEGEWVSAAPRVTGRNSFRMTPPPRSGVRRSVEFRDGYFRFTWSQHRRPSRLSATSCRALESVLLDGCPFVQECGHALGQVANVTSRAVHHHLDAIEPSATVDRVVADACQRVCRGEAAPMPEFNRVICGSRARDRRGRTTTLAPTASDTDVVGQPPPPAMRHPGSPGHFQLGPLPRLAH